MHKKIHAQKFIRPSHTESHLWLYWGKVYISVQWMRQSTFDIFPKQQYYTGRTACNFVWIIYFQFCEKKINDIFLNISWNNSIFIENSTFMLNPSWIMCIVARNIYGYLCKDEQNKFLYCCSDCNLEFER